MAIDLAVDSFGVSPVIIWSYSADLGLSGACSCFWASVLFWRLGLTLNMRQKYFVVTDLLATNG